MSNTYNRDRLLERLKAIPTALKKIPRRFAKISEPNDFEACKVIDRQTDGQLFAQYPEIQWRGVMGLRDVLAHEYFDMDVEPLYAICDRSVAIRQF